MPGALAAALALAGTCDGGNTDTDFLEAESALAALRSIEPEDDLVAIGAHSEPGDIPLLGTSFTAETYAALLWNGERFERHRLPWLVRFLFLGRVVGANAQGAAAGARAGEAMRAAWPPPRTTPIVVDLTVDAVAASVCAATAEGLNGDARERVAELAASLMVVTPALPSAELAGLRAGHALAVGWLAVRLHHSLVTAAPGTSDEVLLTLSAP
ncbi:MAG: hypothetical protein ABIP45_01770 [Knoellia sp.]